MTPSPRAGLRFFSLFAVAAILTASLVSGAAVALLPPGLVVRALIPLLGGFALVLAWVLRSNRESVVSGLEFYGLIGLVALSILWPRYLFLHQGGLPGVNPLTLGAMGMLTLSAMSLVGSSVSSTNLSEQFQAGGVAAKLFFAWFVWGLFASMLGDSPVYSVIELIKQFVYVGSFFIFGLILAGNSRGPVLVVRVIVLCGLVVSVIGIYEAHVHSNPFVGLIGGMGDASAPRALLAIAADKARDGAFRAQSTFDHPIVFAQFVAALIPLALFTATRDVSVYWRIVALVTVPFAVLAIIKSGSRSGYASMGAAISLIAFVWWLRAMVNGRLSKVLAIVAVPALAGAFGIAIVFLEELVAGRSQHEASSTMTRLNMLRDGVTALWDSPIWGFGHGAAIEKAGVYNHVGIATIDNYFLSIALDYGYVGLFLFVSAIVVFSVRAVRYAIKDDSVECSFVGACCASLLALAVTFSGLSIYQNMTMFWLVLCVAFPIIGGRRLFTKNGVFE